ncbi:hypothetical protein LDG_7719 [Legionella drancourtii LLAP12]|uniref:ClpX-type ZB domain-containing protein n=1 Tax=Legionella drancourtii LLAP12 TaxID=658187 RepID=G9ER13_9GAMM|nr:hypothetical protein LDG_7719 [Legionella drancourtii LLAP12]
MDMSKSGNGSGDKVLYCSFCGKSQHEVKKIDCWAFSICL